MALIKAVRIRFAPPCLLQVIELRNKVLGESHWRMLSDLLWDRDVQRQSKLHKPLQLDLRGVRLFLYSLYLCLRALRLCCRMNIASNLQSACR